MSTMDSEDPNLARLSISCFDVPENLLNKSNAKNHFQRFGKVIRIRLRPRQKVCIVEFGDEETAQIALAESGNYEGQNFKTAWTKHRKSSSSVDKKKHRKSTREKDPDWPANPEIQAELDAMKGAFSSSRTYNLRPEGMAVDPVPNISKKSVSLKTSKTRQWKSDKPTKTKQSEAVTVSVSHNPEQEAELLKQVMRIARTSEEKFRVMDARDKLIRLRTVRQSELSRVNRTIGTCPDMCPEKERLMRETQHQVAVYEQASEGSRSTMNHATAVKQYSRSSADQESPLAHELRPVEVLQRTMSYLLHQIMDLCDTPDVNMAEWYHFVWDRTRGVRKDVTQQELCCSGSVRLVEQCARFHVHCSARLVAEDVSVFDQKINTENLTKCLQTLKYMYHDLRVKNGETCPNEAEFRAYIVLLNLNDGNFMWEVQQLDRDIQQSPEVRFALQVYSALDKNNYVRFFKLVRSTTYLNACILLRYFNQVRYRAILTILKSYTARQPYTQYPVSELCQILAFEDVENTIAFLEYYGLALNAERTHVVLERRAFCQPDVPFSLERAINVVESKRQCSVGEVVCGEPLPAKDFLNHVPYNSFDENGYIRLSEIPKEWQGKYQQYLTQFALGELNEERIVDNEEEEQGDVDEDRNDVLKSKFTFSSPAVETSEPKVSVSMPKVTASFTFQSPTNLFSAQEDFSETDSEVPSFFAKYKAKNVDDNRSQSPLTLSKTEPVKPFWTAPKSVFSGGSQSGFDSRKSIFKTDVQTKPSVLEEKNKLTEQGNFTQKPTFPFAASENSSSSNPTTFSFLQPIDSKNDSKIYQTANQTSAEHLKSSHKSKEKLIASSITSFYEQENEDLIRKEKELKEKLLKKQKEAAEREEIRRQQAEAKQLKEQRVVEEMKRKHAAEVAEARIKAEVNVLLNQLLQKVEEDQVKTKLNRIAENIKKRRILQYANRWRNVTKISKKKRKNFFDNPVWISSRSITAEAQELYTPSQGLTLHDMKRYKLGASTDIKIRKPQHIEQLDVFKLVWKILFEKLCSSHDLMNLNMYWKIGVSLPDKSEATNGLYRLEESLQSAFDWEECGTEMMSVKRVFANNGGSLTYCIKKLLKPESDLNGLLFVTLDDDISKTTRKRFTNILARKQISNPIPVIIFIKNGDCNNLTNVVQQLKLNELVDQGIISEYDVYFCTDSNIGKILTASLKSLADNVSIESALEMDALSVCLRNCVGEEFWHRLRSSAKINERLGILLREPNVAIELHNEALNHLLNIIFDSDVLKHPYFPAEFKQFLNESQIILPCTHEYFPDDWKSKTYLNKIKKLIESFMLPSFTESWPPNNQYDFQNVLQQYCSKIFKNSSSVVLKILSVVLKKIHHRSEEEFTDQIKLMSWADMVELIVTEKIKNTNFFDKSHPVYTVVYKSDELKEFRKIPWWYRTSVIKDKIKFVEIEYQSDPEIITDDEDDDIDIDKTVNDIREEILYEDNSEAKQEMKHLTSLLDDLEQSMEIQKKIMAKFQETAKRALECE